MDRYLDGGLRHSGLRRRLTDRQSIDLYMLYGLPCLWRYLRYELLQIEGALDAGKVVLRNHLLGVFDRHVLHRRLRSAEIVEKLVARDRMNPGSEELRWIISVPPRMDRDQNLLQEILRVHRPSADSREPSFEVGAQMAAQPRQQRPVRRRIALEARDHERAEFVLPRLDVHYSAGLDPLLTARSTAENGCYPTPWPGPISDLLT